MFFKVKKPPAPPKGPICRIINDGSQIAKCCGSSSKNKWSWKALKMLEIGCIQPECNNYWARNDLHDDQQVG